MLRLVTLAATAALGAALLAFPATPAVAGDAPAMTGAPEVGSCYDITLRQANGYSVREAPVNCRRVHTALAGGVATLPDGLTWEDEDEVQAFASDTCWRTWHRQLDSRDKREWYRSTYQGFWFAPRKADRDAGARWFSCLMAVMTDRGLVDLPDRLPKLSRENLPDSVARCVTSQYKTTVCSRAHAWRSSHAFYGSGTYTDRHVKAAARRVCPRNVESERYLYSSRDLAGDRFLVGCYAKTRR